MSQKVGHIPVGTTIKGKIIMFCCYGSYCVKKITVALENKEKPFHVAQTEAEIKRTVVVFLHFSFVNRRIQPPAKMLVIFLQSFNTAYVHFQQKCWRCVCIYV